MPCTSDLSIFTGLAICCFLENSDSSMKRQKQNIIKELTRKLSLCGTKSAALTILFGYLKTTGWTGTAGINAPRKTESDYIINDIL